MVLIRVPKPPKSAIDPSRPVNALLMAQVMHLHYAERVLPAKYHTGIYVNAIKTEGEASDYIGAVTGAIHEAHAAATAKRVRQMPKRRRPIEIAAMADGVPAKRKPKKKASVRKQTRSK
ncbi:MAG: hypothetical protein JWN74_1242 [Acidobacteriaceae bacterium]|nr:hypothetical protein [Acidobacteriaceae bacterium]